MGWCSGSEVVEPIARELEKIPLAESIQVSILQILIRACRAQDWDCEYDIAGCTRAYDKALALLDGYNPECPGTCFQIHCIDEGEACGCPCHHPKLMEKLKPKPVIINKVAAEAWEAEQRRLNTPA